MVGRPWVQYILKGAAVKVDAVLTAPRAPSRDSPVRTIWSRSALGRTVGVLFVAVALSTSAACAYPVTLYTGYDPGNNIFGICAAMAILPLLLFGIASAFNRQGSPGFTVGVMLIIFACVGVMFRSCGSGAHHVVTAVSSRALRVSVEPESGARGSSRVVPTSEVECVVGAYESCDREGENCEDRYTAVLLHRGAFLTPWETRTFTSAQEANARCASLAPYGIRSSGRRLPRR